VKGGASPKFCFEAQLWDETIHMSVNLTKVFRQKDQRKFPGYVSIRRD
jgi:ATP-dependent DNA helicase PIF1